ncbi:MAG: hypothetical protein COT67_00675 [Candidatus Tagabacteria bacterium CG09_land_8_20_14_0_10_41_14]|uniref:DUF5673 domain-containing protein n=2 Tax=Candidatus Tagaibacteriota TaxID=1817918 RepID=A0A2H0WLT8_9BACT|nr:MAG: hypothetical protein COT67_00675 [Candidatus Tagabacteria bacterium CG09_land_8_20_14_0_10_41_14]PJE73278.1 MAG: hypothetical protein COV00_00705 [Candidatus Tagabacteria bacterium CG10_big_fil_rev_8_21_14_0_10_40_13]
MINEKTDKSQITWQGMEHSYVPKNTDWFWIVGSVGLAFIIIAVLTHNFLLGVFVITAGLVFVILDTKKPKKINFVVGPKSIKINSRFYRYEEISSFWIRYEPPAVKELLIKLKKNWGTNLKIPINNTNPNLLRKYLLRFIKEEKHEQSLIETIGEVLGF